MYIAGNFNDWSGDATPLEKQPDGSFAADVPLPWGEKQAFKYVVDGGGLRVSQSVSELTLWDVEWKVREDEAKEWGESSFASTACNPEWNRRFRRGES